MFIFIFFNILFTANIAEADSVKKDNVLIIFIDDMRFLTQKELFLPNIRKFAAKSIEFSNAFAQQSLCAPSRNSILTGRRPDALRLYDFFSYWRDVVGNFSTLPQILKERGFDAYSVGKVFHPGRSSNFTDDYPYSWTKEPYHPPSQKYQNAAVCKDKRTKKLQRNLLCPITVKNQPEQTLPDLETLKYAIDILKCRNTTSNPLFLAVGFHKPHIPLKYPREYLQKIPMSNVSPPANPWKPKDMPSVAWHPWADVRMRDDIKNLNISMPYGTMPPKWTMKIKQSYYAAMLYIDDLIGQLMAYVDDNTIVVLTSDHGWSLGENGLWAKYSNFDVALRVPLIFSVPGLTPKSISTPVELVDIFPTIIDLVGLNVHTPKCENVNDKSLCFDGKSLVPLMTNEYHKAHPIRPFAISQFPRPGAYPAANSDKPRLKDIKIMGYSIRTKKFRYTEWISFNNTQFTRKWDKIYGIELYNHLTDDNEANNLVSKAKYRHIKNKLSKLLRLQIDPNY